MHDGKRYARPDDATSEQAVETEAFGGATISKVYCSTSDGPISRFLSCGKGNAIPRRELETLTGLDGRTVRLLIERERRSGVPILSDNRSGYFLPACEQERLSFVRSMRHRAGEIFKTARAIERTGMSGTTDLDQMTIAELNFNV